MLGDETFDFVPIWVVFLVIAGLGLLAFEAGYRGGRWWQARTPDEREGPTGMLVGSLLALFAFLLATTMGMAISRFDARRALVLREANAIGTTFLRAGYLPEPQRSDIQNLLREYAPLRVRPDNATFEASSARSVEIQEEIWVQTEVLARQTPESDVLAIYIESVNDLIDLHTDRVVAGIYARVPDSLFVLLFTGIVVTLGMVGYNAGLTRKRSLIGAVVLVAAMGAVVTLAIDLDRPGSGTVTVSQQALIDMSEKLGAPVE